MAPNRMHNKLPPRLEAFPSTDVLAHIPSEQKQLNSPFHERTPPLLSFGEKQMLKQVYSLSDMITVSQNSPRCQAVSLGCNGMSTLLVLILSSQHVSLGHGGSLHMG